MMLANGGMQTAINFKNSKRAAKNETPDSCSIYSNQYGMERNKRIALNLKANSTLSSSSTGPSGGKSVAGKLNRNAKIELKDDIAKSLARFVRAIKTTCKKYDLNQVDNENSNTELNAASVATPVSQANVLAAKLPQQWTKATAGWGQGKFACKATNSVSNFHGDKHSTSQWIPNIERTLQRSLSLQQSKFNRTSIASKLRNHGSISRRHQRKPSSFWMDNSASLKSVPVLFIILNFLALLSLSPAVFAAPIPAVAVIQPIWLHNGLMNIDQSSLDLDPEPQVQTIDESRIDALIEAFSKQQQLEQQLRSAEEPVEQAQILEPFVSSFIEPPQENDPQFSSVAQPSEELLWIQRRRLNRDRALEPPFWLRERPTRRGSTITFDDANYDQDALEIPRQTEAPTAQPSNRNHVPSDQSPRSGKGGKFPRKIRGRQSRQLSDDLYKEILEHLIHETLENQSLVNELYDELQRRYSSGQKSAKLLQSSLQAQHSQQPKLAHSIENNEKVSEAYGNSGSLVVDPDAALIVASDEVSGNEDAATQIDGSPTGSLQSSMSAAYSRDTPTSQDYGRVQISDMSNGIVNSANRRLTPNLQSILRATTGDNLADGYTYGRIINSHKESPAMMGSGGQQYYSSYDLNDQTVAPDSFHIIEDIDQADDSQSVPNPQSNSQQSDDFGGASNEQIVMPLINERRADDSWLSAGNAPGTSGRFIAKRAFVNEFMAANALAGHPVKRLTAKLATNARDPNEATPMQPSGAFVNQRLSSTALKSYGDDSDSGALSSTASNIIEASSREQLVRAATRLKFYLEDLLELPRAAIVGLFPTDTGKGLLIKLDQSKLSNYDLLKLRQNYEYGRGFIMINWPTGSPQNPLPLLRAILNALYKEETLPVNQTIEDENLPSESEESIQNELQQLHRALDVARSQQQTTRRFQYTRQAPVLTPDELAQEEEQRQQQPIISAGDNGAQLDVAPIVVAEIIQTSNTDTDAADEDADDGNQDDGLQGGWRGVDTLAGGSIGGARLPLASLAAYLNALSFAQRHDNLSQFPFGRLSGAPLQQVQLTTNGISALRQRVGLQQNEGQTSSMSRHMRHPSLYQLAAFFIAFMGTFLAVKFVMQKYDKKLIGKRRRRHSSAASGDDESPPDSASYASKSKLKNFWSSGSLAHAATFVGASSKQAEAEAGNPIVHRRQSSDSGHGTVDSGDEKRKNLDVLTQKLIGLLRLKPAGGKHDDVETAREATASPTTKTKPSSNTEESQRSSISYIKSLIEVLSKARPQVFSSKMEDISSGLDEDTEASCQLISKSSAEGLEACESLDGANQQRQQVDELITSQMDISAAHLILNYMEKHLDDKERLRREWRELNAGGSLELKGGSANNNGNKMNQLVLQKLAKVALSEENRSRNRNPLFVPFDRNRVKLGGASSSTSTLTSTSTSPPSSHNKRAAAQKGSSATTTSDYINASFIYDDDPRRPTHIIAQGPTEQTCGQFWQMIWEQDISVIVMLTRLNENNAKMCHCYWPTNIADGRCNNNNVATSSSGTSQSGVADQPATPTSPADANGQPGKVCTSAGHKQSSPDASVAISPTAPGTTNGRRGSVTSVFNTISGCARQGAIGMGQPIIANGDLGDNVLIFDVGEGPLQQGTSTGDASSSSSSSSARGAKDKSRARTGGVTQLEVQLVSEHVSSGDYLVRNLYLTNRSSGETRTITQFHYLSWLDNSAPENVKSFLQFRRKVHKSYRNLNKPILVHCSDGAGRSGTYCLIDIILERIRNGAKEIDPRATLEHLRDQRAGLCATLGQFEFVLVALAEEIQIILNALPR